MRDQRTEQDKHTFVKIKAEQSGRLLILEAQLEQCKLCVLLGVMIKDTYRNNWSDPVSDLRITSLTLCSRLVVVAGLDPIVSSVGRYSSPLTIAAAPTIGGSWLS
jgi:hypothetical protein